MAVHHSVLATAVWEFNLKVSSVINHIGGTVEVLSIKEGAIWTPCEDVEWYSFDIAQPGAKAMQASLLTALAGGKTISLIYNCDNNSIGAVKIDA